MMKAGDLVKLKNNYRKKRFGSHPYIGDEVGLILEISPKTRYMEATVLVAWGGCGEKDVEVEFPHWLEVVNASR